MLTEPTVQMLLEMRFGAMADAYLEQQRDPKIDELNFDERFGLLVDAEHLARKNRRLTNLLRKAQLRISTACIEDVECSSERGLARQTVRQLASCKWVEERNNIVITGLTGVGKTYLACAFAQQACRRGHRTLYRRVPRLLDEITLARADGTWPSLLRL
jgi:DNA replication protein DnaC